MRSVYVISDFKPTIITEKNEKEFGIKLEHEGKNYGIPKSVFNPDLLSFKVEKPDEHGNVPINISYDDGDLDICLMKKTFPSSGFKEDIDSTTKEKNGKFSIGLALFSDEKEFNPTLDESCIMALNDAVKHKYIEYIKSVNNKLNLVRNVKSLEFDVKDFFRCTKNDCNKPKAQKRAYMKPWMRSANNPKNKVKGVPDIFTSFSNVTTKKTGLKFDDFKGLSGVYGAKLGLNRYLIGVSGHTPGFTLKSLVYRKADVLEGSYTDPDTDNMFESMKVDEESKFIENAMMNISIDKKIENDIVIGSKNKSTEKIENVEDKVNDIMSGSKNKSTGKVEVKTEKKEKKEKKKRDDSD